ncbi:MAG: hypothetical protein PHU49_00665 [Syntrophorhabdaceae bacterium]|nr:hypothetical protein [Syntrophorhabdaceae bacterium]MDD5242504.1 hypothetical protein [Syntrophorhabdaceae bacterium]
MPVLFIQNWDVVPGFEDEYARFITETYIPETTTMDLISVGGYYVEMGFGPRIIAVLSAKDAPDLARVVTTERFENLTVRLKAFVYDYGSYVLAPTGNLEHEKYVIQKQVWKFNQYYDLRPGAKKQYIDFVLNEHLPAIRTIDYVEATGGWNVIFGDLCEVIVEFTLKDPLDIGRLLNHQDFRRVTDKLRREYVVNYRSRMLRCTERFGENRWVRL